MTSTEATTIAGPDAELVELAHGSLHHRRAGDPAGPPVLYLHGAFFATNWLAFHDALGRAADLRAPILPGYAEGGPPPWLEGFDDLVLVLRDYLDDQGLTTVHVVGHGLGAWVAAELAAFYPERVASFTAITPMGLRVPGAPLLDLLGVAGDRLPDLLFNGASPLADDLLPAADDIDGFVRLYGENGVTARLIWERRYDLKLDRRLPLLTMPALVIGAGEDRVIPNAHVDRWVELVPGARKETVVGTGHALIAQEPEAVADLVTAFVRGAAS